MKCAPGQLTDEQIKTTYFDVPDLGIGFAFGADVLAEVQRQRREAQGHGHAFRLIGWPDGTTLSCEFDDRNEPLDAQKLVALYRGHHRVVQAIDAWRST